MTGFSFAEGVEVGVLFVTLSAYVASSWDGTGEDGLGEDEV